MIKAIFFDIDGTLLSFKTHTMPESTRNALNLLKEKNVKLFIATGRPPESLSGIKHILDFDFDGYITLNGQYCIIDNKVIHEVSLPAESLISVLPYIEKNNISTVFVELDYSYINHINDRVKKLKELLGNTDEFPPVDDVNRIYKNKIYQLCPYITEDEEEEFFKHMPHCRPVRWNPLFVDIIPEYGGKPVGIQKILDYCNFTKEECMAFGDGGNDIGMLQFAEIGIAMGNATDNVKESADYITTNVDDHGIMNALKYFKII